MNKDNSVQSGPAGTGFVRRWRLLVIMAVVLAAGLQGCSGSASTPTPTPTPATPTAAPAASASMEPAYWPTQSWRTSTPEEQGIDSAQLLAALQHIDKAGINIRTIMVIRNGYVVTQASMQPYTLDMPFQMYSVAKSVTGALVGIAIHEGYIKDVNQKVLSYFPELTIANRDANKEAITIQDLLTMRPGLDCSDDKLNFAMERSPNWVQFTLDLPMASTPGEKMIYCTPGPHILSAILTRATGMSTAEYARTRLFEPLGIAPGNIAWQADPQGINIGGYGITAKPADMAKFGLLYLSGGKWEGKQVVPQEWVTASSQVHATFEDNRDYGYLFWLYPDHYAAQGLGEQRIQVVPDRKMVVVVTSAIPGSKGSSVVQLLQDYIIPAARSNGPLPANTAALQSLQAYVNYMANPVQPVAALSDTARRVSGKTYVMDDNPNGWKKVTLTFPEGSLEALATVEAVDGEATFTQTATIGLDNVYRVEKSENGSFTARRGQWVDDHTFVVRELQSSPDLQETEITVDFGANTVKVHVEEVVLGTYNYDMQGHLAGTN